MKVLKWIGFGILGLGFIALLIFVTMHLWNWLVPELFHGPVITFCQTAGLLILSKILFSGFGHCRGGGHHRRHHHHGEGDNNDACCGNHWWSKYHRRGGCCSDEKKSE